MIRVARAAPAWGRGVSGTNAAVSARSVSVLTESRISETQKTFSKSPDRVAVRVPATSANLGPGFDAFGFAVDVWNEVTVEKADKFSLKIEGDGAGMIPETEDNLVVQACKTAMKAQGLEMPPLKFVCRNSIPPTRGLGSSSAALVGGLSAGLALGGKDLNSSQTRKMLLQLAAKEEGHPDNVAPAVYGGFQVAIHSGNQWITQRVNIPKGLQMVLFIPTFELPTKEARAVLPERLTYEDAVFNIGRASMLVHCFATGQFEPLRYAMEDRLHQPQRAHMFPFYDLIQTALEAGAHGAFLSGAGPTVLAVTGGQSGNAGQDTMAQFLAEEVSAAMTQSAKEKGIDGYVHIAEPTQLGVHQIDFH